MSKFLKKSLLAAAVAGSLAFAANAQAELKFQPGEGDQFNWDSFEAYKEKVGDQYDGEKLTIFGPWVGPDEDLIESVTSYFAEATGAEVDYVGSDSFEQQIVIDAQAGSPANIGVFPQPGLAKDMASKGFLTPLSEGTDAWVEENYAAGDSWVSLGRFPDQEGEEQFYGFFYKVDLKSMVWYVPENFEDYGYELPESMEDLKALTKQMVEDGNTPWCIGLGSGDATGWPATDWVEDMMLRTQSGETYDKWVSNEIKFDDPAVIEAIEEFGWFARNDDYVAGGSDSVASTDFRDSAKGLFDSPPKCFMHRQASFIPTFFPEGTEMGLDADFFYFPAYADKDLGKPVLGAGTMFSILEDAPVAHAFIDFLKTPIAHEVWMAQQGFLTPYKEANVDAYANDSLRKQGEVLLEATTFRFDASDLMPGKIGAGAFWKGMVNYVGGESADDVAGGIQENWDALSD